MKDIIATRDRLQRLLDALGHTSTADQELREQLYKLVIELDLEIAEGSETGSEDGSTIAA